MLRLLWFVKGSSAGCSEQRNEMNDSMKSKLICKAGSYQYMSKKHFPAHLGIKSTAHHHT
jgi:hypothetical protein